MIIRLGYVAKSQTLETITSSSTITYSNFSKEEDYQKLATRIRSNLQSLITILTYNQKNNIHFYRLSSNLIPLATHPKVSFDYIKSYLTYYHTIATLLHKTNMRVDMHPSNYCILNSTRKEVVAASIEILKYHYRLLEAMQITNKLVILHIGSSTFGKQNSLTRFIHNFQKLPPHLQQIIAIENDDKVFNIEDCLYLANILHIPVVLDYHHFQCNPAPLDITTYLEAVLNTWKNQRPKIHFSSPRSKKEFRAHHDYINSEEFIKFLSLLKKYSSNYDGLDIMLEAKAKDEALFRLIRQLKYQTNYQFIDDTTFEI